MSPAELTKLRLTLKRNGYAPLPACGKEVYLSGWPTKVDVSEAEIARWAEQHPEWSNTGINTRDVPAVDVDITDPEAATACEDSMRDWFDGRGTIAPRFGTLPKRTVLLRTAAPFKKIRADFVAPNGATHHIEILGDGQQTIVFGFNPDAKRAYSWHGDRSPLNTPRDDLPEIDEGEARELINFLSDMLAEKLGFVRKEDTTPTTSNGDSSPFVTNQRLDVDACLANMGPTGAGVNDAQTSAILSLLQKAIHPDDVIETVVDATMRMANRANLGWSREVEIKEVTSRCSSSLKHLHKEFDARTGVIPPWLPGDFHNDWAQVLTEGRTPHLTRNASGWYVRGSRQADAKAQQSDKPIAEAPSATLKEKTAETPPKKYKFPLLWFDEMRPGVEPNYLVDELVPVAGLVVAYGAPKSGKSFWTLDLMMHVALGWEYRDRYVQQGTVVYCAFEGAHGYHKRIEAFRRHHSVIDERPPLCIVPGRADLVRDHATLIANIKAQVEAREGVGPVRAVVLDTLNKSLIGSESKDVDMANYIAAAEAIQAAFGCVVIIVHHHGIDESRPRGHTSLRGAVDTQIKVVRDEQNAIIVEVEDMRDGPEGQQIVSRLIVVEVGVDRSGKPLTSAAIEPVDPTTRTDKQKLPKLTRNQRTMFSILDSAPTGLTTADWNEQARQAGIGAKRHADLHDLRASLRHRALVYENGGSWFVVAKFKSAAD